ncbi:class I SAM-dependent methyltransferase [Methanoculleus sp. FWC-SCC1]|uniref:Class I SAM-dependent methyltransferase n=1 Tax=Methanoculleus frigidifontis TaxID=2584085 RepID=A0ABT8MDM1_9EURY|nr:class I SAM-dependent methyltransferase [Methanoculleus sp. FWC-SCC1]MDN7025955.1 class I SAM-dependent methyltransferase [Methanoculleus sp. FWC-SCC1]
MAVAAGTAVRMSDGHFRLMSLAFRIRDLIRPPEKMLAQFGIREGMTVVDYGCGPGSYIKTVSDLVGPDGTVYAVDVHDLAVEAVSRRIETEGLANVVPALAKGYDSGLPDGAADLIYALDMFFMVEDTDTFLAELWRITKPDGVLIVDDGHQPREKTRRAIRESGSWTIEEEKREYLRCRPVLPNRT